MGQKIKTYPDSVTIKRVLDCLQGATFAKGSDPGQAMTTLTHGSDPYLETVCKNLAAGRPIIQEQFRYLVWAVDLAAVSMPDNVLNCWDGEVLNLASKLRQSYAAVYGEKAYA